MRRAKCFRLAKGARLILPVFVSLCMIGEAIAQEPTEGHLPLSRPLGIQSLDHECTDNFLETYRFLFQRCMANDGISALMEKVINQARYHYAKIVEDLLLLY